MSFTYCTLRKLNIQLSNPTFLGYFRFFTFLPTLSFLCDFKGAGRAVKPRVYWEKSGGAESRLTLALLHPTNKHQFIRPGYKVIETRPPHEALRSQMVTLPSSVAAIHGFFSCSPLQKSHRNCAFLSKGNA